MRKLLIGFLAMGAIGAVIKNAPQTVPPPPRPGDYSPMLVEMAVKRLLRDPESARFGRMDAYGDRMINGRPVTAVCGSVNARNGFGGYGGPKDFVVVQETMTAIMEGIPDNTTFAKTWNALCAGKHTAK